MKRIYISIIVIIVIIFSIINSIGMFDDLDSEVVKSDQNLDESKLECQLQIGKCYSGIISKIVDGDTIHLQNKDSIRLTLINSAEIDTEKGVQSKLFLESICPVGSTVHIDEDDGQLQGSHGRLIGMVYCNNDNVSLNEKIIENGHGIIYKKFCSKSEFGEEKWTIKYGC